MEHRGHPLRGRLWSTLLPVGLVVASVLVAVATATSSPMIEAQGSTGADLYAANCAGCHQANGEGIPGTFPPLADNPNATDPDHVATVITEGLTGKIEVLGETYDSAMPPIAGLSDGDVDALVAHVVELAGGGTAPPVDPTGPTDPSGPTEPVEPPAAGDIDRGHDLFVGRNRLDNGGSSCASCHTAGEVGNLGGSSLGPDLTGSYERLGGAAGLSAWLTNPPSATMMPVFADRPLTETEIADLVVFLADTPNQTKPTYNVDWLLIAGLVGLVVLLGGMTIAWRGPRKTYVQTLRSKR
jgi:mono/diheme cytochrome c family protein